MATSILRLGRLGSLKCFQSQGWMVWRNCSAASFCTQAEDPPKRPKKTQPASKTVAPEERASLLANRTAVIFPVKVAETSVFPVNSAGSYSSSSSSSSSSDSDSDSDSDDELSQAKTQISEPTMKHESGDRKVTSKLKEDTEETKPKYDGSARETDKFVVPKAEICSEGTQGAAAGALSGAPTEAEPGNSPESTEAAVSPAGPDVSAEDVSTASPPADASADFPAGTKGSTSAGSPKALAVEHGEAADGAGAEVAEGLEGCSSPADAAVESPEAVESEASSSTERCEELMDAAPVRAESVGEELQPEETAAAPPEPEEPLDIRTYKNYQHHSYHPFTFADMDVEMAKYRLPQPTSNRH